MKNKIMFLVAAVLVALAVPSWGVGQFVGEMSYVTNLGTSRIDTLNWSDQGQFSLRDTITAAIKDTTTAEIDITGCNYISMWVIASSHRATTYHNINYNVQISSDKSNWIQMTGVFSTMTKAATPATDTTVCILLQAALQDTALGANAGSATLRPANGRDQRLVKAGRWLRVIAVPSGGTSTDTTFIFTVLRRQWPAPGK